VKTTKTADLRIAPSILSERLTHIPAHFNALIFQLMAVEAHGLAA